MCEREWQTAAHSHNLYPCKCNRYCRAWGRALCSVTPWLEAMTWCPVNDDDHLKERKVCWHHGKGMQSAALSSSLSYAYPSGFWTSVLQCVALCYDAKVPLALKHIPPSSWCVHLRLSFAADSEYKSSIPDPRDFVATCILMCLHSSELSLRKATAHCT